MIVTLFSLLIIGGLTYAYLNDREQFTATASAIHQIWAGNCRLSCRQDARQNEAASNRDEGRTCIADSSTNDYDSDLSRTYQSAPNCICDSCPCALVDDLLSNRYKMVRERDHDYNSEPALVDQYNSSDPIANSYNSLGAAIGSLRPCEQHAHFTSLDRVGSEENFRFGATPAKTGSKKKSAKSDPTEEGTSKGQASMSVIKFASDDERSDANNCSRCVSQGKTCMKTCPKAKK